MKRAFRFRLFCCGTTAQSLPRVAVGQARAIHRGALPQKPWWEVSIHRDAAPYRRVARSLGDRTSNAFVMEIAVGFDLNGKPNRRRRPSLV